MFRCLILLLLLVSCNPKIVHYINTKARFSAYQSFVILAGKSSSAAELKDSTSLMWRIEDQIKSQLELRGYKQNNDNPDLIVRYDVVSNTESRTPMSSFPMGYYSYFNNMNMQTFTQSIIIIEMLDEKTTKLVWQSSMDIRDLDVKLKKKDPVNGAIQHLFNTYLYRSSTSKPDPLLNKK
jgi:hypothetical protein